ncbi:SMR domain-containing protein [Drosera capensis]
MRNSRKKKKKRMQEDQKREEGGELKVEKERVVVSRLVEAFGLASVEEEAAAYSEANWDVDRAAEILTGWLLYDDNDDDDVVETETETVSGTGCSSSSGRSGSGPCSSDGNGCVFVRDGGNKGFRGCSGKKAVAATGMVSNMMGKGYLGTKSRMSWRTQLRGTRGWSDWEGFCGHDVEKLTDWAYDSTSHSSDRDTNDNAQALDYSYSRNYLEALLRSSSSSEGHSSERHLTSQTNDDLELPEKVLRSLFNFPESSQREPGSMNWKNVVKQVESFAQKRVGLCAPGSAGAQQAAVAHSNGAREYSSYLSDQAKLQIQQARKEDEKASMEIFNARNKGVENVITIDLHGQHVKQAIRLVKLHLLFGTCISSVRCLRVITGCGTGRLGKSKLKESVISLLDRESIQWKEENRGAVVISLNGPREFSFLDSGSDSD